MAKDLLIISEAIEKFLDERKYTTLRDVLKTMQAADIAGIRTLIVHAKDDAARLWYEKWGFEPSPTDPYHLFLLLKDLKAILT